MNCFVLWSGGGWAWSLWGPDFTNTEITPSVPFMACVLIPVFNPSKDLKEAYLQQLLR